MNEATFAEKHHEAYLDDIDLKAHAQAIVAHALEQFTIDLTCWQGVGALLLGRCRLDSEVAWDGRQDLGFVGDRR